MPDPVRMIGGPALTAMVIDRGGDLNINGLALTIDGQPVAASMLFYDAASGYFAVDGPLALADGPHVAKSPPPTAMETRPATACASPGPWRFRRPSRAAERGWPSTACR
jgi:hypothetical protein